MKYLLTIKIILIFIIVFGYGCCCQCDKDYVNEARNFCKDTALMYVWKHIYKDTKDVEYCYYSEIGDYFDGYTINNMTNRGTWYIYKNTIRRRMCGAENGETDRLHGKYILKNDTLFVTHISGIESNDTYMKEPFIYTKVSKHP